MEPNRRSIYSFLPRIFASVLAIGDILIMIAADSDYGIEIVFLVLKQNVLVNGVICVLCNLSFSNSYTQKL